MAVIFANILIVVMRSLHLLTIFSHKSQLLFYLFLYLINILK